MPQSSLSHSFGPALLVKLKPTGNTIRHRKTVLYCTAPMYMSSFGYVNRLF